MGQGLLTEGFVRAPDGVLHCEGIAIERIARSVGTPLYVYSTAIIRERYQRLAAVLAGAPHRIHYTLKANSSRAVLRLLCDLGAGAEVVSGGELERALRAGFAPRDIVFGGVGKTDVELEQALHAGLLLINVESDGELRRLDRIAGRLGITAPIGLRVNPELTVAVPHDYIKTGERGHKFGIPYDQALDVARAALSLRHVVLVALDMHLGSQLSRVEPYQEGAERLIALYRDVCAAGARDVRFLDVGGGLSVRYDDEEPPDLERFAQLVVPPVAATGLTLIMEPGRFIVGNAGALVATVLDRKRSGGKEYVVVDAGMTELLRPSHYGAFHRIEPVGDTREARGPGIVADVVGPVCETGDFLALDRAMPDVRLGELIAVHDVGAYGYVMASTYNGRRRAPEVLVDGDRWAVITRRETFDDLVRLDVDEPAWRS